MPKTTYTAEKKLEKVAYAEANNNCQAADKYSGLCHLIVESWAKIKIETIQNGFRKAGIKPVTETDNDINCEPSTSLIDDGQSVDDNINLDPNISDVESITDELNYALNFSDSDIEIECNDN